MSAFLYRIRWTIPYIVAAMWLAALLGAFWPLLEVLA